MANFEKPIWERIPGTYDLKVNNPSNLDFNKYRQMLKNIELPTDYNKDFSEKAVRLINEWFDNPDDKPLKEAAYCFLSNWPLTSIEKTRKSSRSVAIWQLWDELFCARPQRRLTNWKISGAKVIPAEFDLWWQKQQDCQSHI